MNVILAIGIFLIVGFLGGRLARILKLPAITGYIFVGFIIGPHFSELIPERLISRDLHFLPELILGLIALSIGGRLKVDELKGLGKDIAYIALSQAALSFFFVFLCVFLFILFLPKVCGLEHGYPLISFILPLSLLLGAISITTGPATTASIISECKARGIFSITLLSTVAVDNAIGIILFAIVFAISRVLAGGTGEGTIAPFLQSLSEIGGALLLGTIIGTATGFSAHRFRKDDLLVITLGTTMLATGLAVLLRFSVLMTNMMAGFIIANRAKKSERLFRAITVVEMPVYIVFFVLAGTHFNWRLLPAMGTLGIIYVLARGAGKVIGAGLGAVKAGASEVLRRYLGPALISQAGVAIGFILLVQNEPAFANFSGIVSTIVMAGVLINELIGPPLAKRAITRAGEAHLSPSSVP